MLVVILVVGILAAITIPSWLGFVEVRRLNNAQEEVHQALRQAQSQAINHKLTWQVSLREKMVSCNGLFIQQKLANLFLILLKTTIICGIVFTQIFRFSKIKTIKVITRQL